MGFFCVLFSLGLVSLHDRGEISEAVVAVRLRRTKGGGRRGILGRDGGGGKGREWRAEWAGTLPYVSSR